LRENGALSWVRCTLREDFAGWRWSLPGDEV